MSRKRLLAGTVAAMTALVFAVTALAVEPKTGTYKGTAEPSGKPIKIRITDDDDVEATVRYCGYLMDAEFKRNGKFSAKHRGPGGVYVGLDGGFPNKNTARGTITTDFLCNSEGNEFKAEYVDRRRN
jgi:hypothetical protein